MRELIRLIRNWPRQVPYLARIARLIWSSSGRWTILWLLLLAILGILPAAVALWTKHLVDALVSALHSKPSIETFRPAFFYGGLTVGATLLIEALQSLLEWVRTLQSELLQDAISSAVQKKSVEVDFAFYESPEYYDNLYRARDEASTRPALLIEHLGAVIQNSISIIALTVIILRYTPWMVLAMAASVIPAFLVMARFNWLMHQWWRNTTVERRWIQYYDQKFTTAAAAAEMRLFRLGDLFRSQYSGLRGLLRRQRLSMVRSQSVSRVLATVIGLIIVVLSLAWMGWRTYHGAATLGDLTLFYQAIVGGQSLMRIVTSSLTQVYSNSLFLGDFFHFLDMAPSVADRPNALEAPLVLRQGIEFSNVTFHYPGTERVALDNFSLVIPAGKIVAIVGPNGAGKSTLVKLLCRFYDPVNGAIMIDGVDIRDMSIDSLRSRLSVLFQIPISYDASARENIGIGDLNRSSDLDYIQRAARSAGAHEIIERLPSGYNTLLGKSFANGCELSAGEWQRVAMARAYFRNAPIVLLDEPTSFMDSWAEIDWFDRLRELTRGKTTLMITHRFTIAMRADWINVMNQGRIIESGTHQSLLARGGFYAQSWEDQQGASRQGALGHSVDPNPWPLDGNVCATSQVAV